MVVPDLCHFYFHPGAVYILVYLDVLSGFHAFCIEVNGRRIEGYGCLDRCYIQHSAAQAVRQCLCIGNISIVRLQYRECLIARCAIDDHMAALSNGRHILKPRQFRNRIVHILPYCLTLRRCCSRYCRFRAAYTVGYNSRRPVCGCTGYRGCAGRRGRNNRLRSHSRRCRTCSCHNRHGDYHSAGHCQRKYFFHHVFIPPS